MPWSIEQQQRLAFDEKLIELYMSGFAFHDKTGNTYVEGDARTNSGNMYKGRLCLPPNYPDEEPALYVVNPHTLWMFGNHGTINAMGTSHAFHVYDNGPDSCVKICHTIDWEPSMTCVKVLQKLHLWLEAYESHLRTGRSIDECLAQKDNL